LSFAQHKDLWTNSREQHNSYLWSNGL